MTASEAVGWRYWWLRTRDGRLFSPHGVPAPGDPFGKRSLVPWDSSRFEPTCPECPTHCPPVPDCLCGVYFSPYVLDVMGLAQQLRLEVERTQGPPSDTFLVIGRLSMAGPIHYQMDRGEMFEGRAAAATIEHLWVTPEWLPNGRPARRQVTNKLKGRYRVPVEIGRPDYTPQDAHHPAALRIELDRLARDGR